MRFHANTTHVSALAVGSCRLDLNVVGVILKLS